MGDRIHLHILVQHPKSYGTSPFSSGPLSRLFSKLRKARWKIIRSSITRITILHLASNHRTNSRRFRMTMFFNLRRPIIKMQAAKGTCISRTRNLRLRPRSQFLINESCEVAQIAEQSANGSKPSKFHKQDNFG